MFLRRIHLDLVGMIPVYEETTAFLGDTDPEKRAKLIDRLLVDPRYGRQQAQVFDLAILTRDLVVDPSWAINAAGAPHPSAFQALQRLSLTTSTPSASVQEYATPKFFQSHAHQLGDSTRTKKREQGRLINTIQP